MKRRFIISTSTLLLLVMLAKAQDTIRLSEQDVFSIIDKTYPQIQYYESKINAIRTMAEGAKAWMPPAVGLAFDRFPYRLSMTREKNPDNQAGIMLSVQQMIPNPAKLNAKKNYLSSLENAQGYNLGWQKNVLHFTAKLYYYQRFTAEKRLGIIRQYRQLLTMVIKTAKDHYTHNQAELSTIYKAEASLSELANMETMVSSQIAESNIGLNTLMNRDVNTPFNIDTFLPITNYSTEYLFRIDSVRLERSDILSVESNIRSMEMNKRLAATGYKPDFGLQLSHGQMLGMPRQFTIMGMITIPIAPWSSKMYRAEVKSMQFEIEAMQKEKSTMQLMATQMIKEKMTMLVYEARQLSNYDNGILPSYRKNFESNLLAYQQNTGNFFVLLDAWNMLLMKELERTDKLGRLLTVKAEYEYQREIN